MSFGATAPPLILEGDYSEWTEIWEWDFPDSLASTYNQCMVFEGDFLYVQYKDGAAKGRFAVIDLTAGSTKFISPSGEHYSFSTPGYEAGLFFYNTVAPISAGAKSFSIRGKYVIIGKYDEDTFEVWKDGVKVWTSPLANEAVSGASTYYGVGIRHDGRFIVAVTDNEKVVCFEGS